MGVLLSGGPGTLLVVDAGATELEQGKVPLGNVLSSIEMDSTVIRLDDRFREKLKEMSFSALILCRWQATTEGVELLSYARKLAPDLPILVVGCAERKHDSVAAYECGADNYFEFPCIGNAVAARLRRLLGRRAASQNSVSVSDLQIWADAGIAFRSGKPIKLSSKEKELLLYLVAHRSRPVTRAELLENVFGLSFEPGTNVVEVHIHRLRRKIDGGHTERLLNTIRGSGYVLGNYADEMAVATA